MMGTCVVGWPVHHAQHCWAAGFQETPDPPGWNRWSAAEKVEHLLGLSLDRMHDYLSWPADGLDPHRLAAQTQVIRVVAVVAAKVGDEARRERERDRVLGKLLRGFEEASRE